ncbi:MAG: histidine phosphatase family protein [Streptosporangiaceae bacterium]
MEGLPGDPAARAGCRRGSGCAGRRPGRTGAALTSPAPETGPTHWTGPGSHEVVRLLLWRHGQTDYNVQRRFQGQSDVPLNAEGRRQALRAARHIAALQPTAIFSSDLSRATATARALAKLTGLPVQHDKDLRERSGGSWEGLTDVEIREQYPEQYRSWDPPDGESVQAVTDRAAAALQRIADGLDGGALAVVVSHGAALGMGAARLLGVSAEQRMLGPLGNCSWSVVGRRASRWRLLAHNIGMLPEPVSLPEAGDVA